MGEAVRSEGNGVNIAQMVATLVAADGTAAHGYAAGLQEPGISASLPNLADAAHYLCMLHGRHPGVIDHAASRTTDNVARHWLVQASDAFAVERSWLTQVTVAAGPLPSTAGQSDCEATVVQQRHALDMLAQSDRRGCAMGAAVALVLDWQAVRALLDTAAIRMGLEPRPGLLPPRAATLAMADALCTDDATFRAMQFGARQLLSQHRGLWDLLSARAQLRSQQ